MAAAAVVANYITATKAANYWTAAGEAQVVLPSTANGPEDIGLVASGSDLIASSGKLNIYPSLVQTITRLPVPRSPQDVRLIWLRSSKQEPIVVRYALWMWDGEVDSDVNILHLPCRPVF